MSRDSPTLGPGNEILSVEKIQNGIKDFFAQRGMLGDDVKGCRTGQNITYSLKDKDEEANINHIIKSIVEKSTLDLANLRQLIVVWDREERAASASRIDESSYGVLTQEKIKQHLKDFFSQRIVVADREEGACGGDSSALKIFARSGAARDADVLFLEGADDGDVSEEPGPGRVSEEPGRVSEEPGRVSEEPGRVSEEPGRVSEEPGRVSEEPGRVSEEPGRVSEEPGRVSEEPGHVISPASSASLLEKAKDLISQVLNPVVDSIGKTIVEKVKMTLEKTVSMCSDKTKTEQSPDGPSPMSEGNLTPERYLLSSMSDARAETTTPRADFRDREAPEVRRPSTGLPEEAVWSRPEDPETDHREVVGSLEGRSLSQRSEGANQGTPRDDPTRISSGSLERTSTASNLVHDMVDVLCLPDSPERRSSEGRLDGVATGLSVETAHTDPGSSQDLVEKRPSSDFAWTRGRLVETASPGAVGDLEMAGSRGTSETDADCQWQEDHRGESSLESVDPSHPSHDVAKSFDSDGDLDWPVVNLNISPEVVDSDEEFESRLSKRSDAVDDDSQWPQDQRVRAQESFDVTSPSPEDAVRRFDVKSCSTDAADRAESVSRFYDTVAETAFNEDFDCTSTRLKPKLSEDRVSRTSSSPEEGLGLVAKLSESRLSRRASSKAADAFELSEDRTSYKSLSPVEEGVVSTVSESRLSRRDSSKVGDVSKWSEDRLSQKSMSSEEVGIGPKFSEGRLSRDSSKAGDVCKWSDEISQKSSSSEEVGFFPKMQDSRLSRRASSISAVDVRKLSEDRMSRKSASSAEMGISPKWSESRLSRSSSKSSLDVRNFSEGRLSRRPSSKDAMKAISRLSQDRISRRSSSRDSVDVICKSSVEKISRWCLSREAADPEPKLSEEKIPSSRVPGDHQLKSSKDSRSSVSSSDGVKESFEETTEPGKTSPELQAVSSDWNRVKLRRGKRKISWLLEDCPGSFLECISTQPSIRPIFKKLSAMWKTHYGRRKSKRVKSMGERKNLRTRLSVLFKERPPSSLASCIKLAQSPPGDGEDEASGRPPSAQSFENAHNIHSFFENMFIREFSARLEKSLKRGLLDVVNDYNERISRDTNVDKPKPK
ncbi:uncharacterized protein LOC144066246 [Stigmatopora argus]